MTPRKQECVTFISPGSFFAETTTQEISSRDTKLAVEMAENIVERHGAQPYGFQFGTRIVADPVPDGCGGVLQVESKTINKSGTYFLGGKLETYDDVVVRDDPSEKILRSNMRCNAMWIVCVTIHRYKSTQPFEEPDFIVDATGNIVERGDDHKHVTYRAAKQQERDAEIASYNKF